MRFCVYTCGLLILAGCSGGNDDVVDAGAGTDTTVRDAGVSTTLGTAERPARIVAPDSPSNSSPLIVLLHGYTSSAAAEDLYLGLSRQARTRGVYVLLPNGTVDSSGNPFWNATPACCNFNGSTVDDVAYLRDLVHEAEANFPIDPARVYFVGHSNGGFMSYRMACEMANEVAAIGVLAGSDFATDSDCVPSRAVSVIHFHGTADDSILYDGGGPSAYPGAEDVTARWAARASCTGTLAAIGAPIDVIPALAGAETDVLHYDGCPAGIDIQLDRMNGAGHVPVFSTTAWGDVIDWLTAHHL